MKLIALDIESSGLEPDKSRITCIGVASEYGIVQFSARLEQDEKVILQEFVDWLDSFDSDSVFTLLTYNGRKFDLPFIFYRALHLGVNIPQDLLSGPHIDMFDYATHANAGVRIPKDLFLSKYLNMYVPRSCSGAWLARQYSAKKMTMDGHLQNLLHNATDLAMTLRAYEELITFEDFNQFCREQREIK